MVDALLHLGEARAEHEQQVVVGAVAEQRFL